VIRSIKKIMTNELVTISPDHSVRKAIEMMENYKIGCLPVLENSQLVGLITSRDVRSNHPNRIVADAMSKKIITISPNCSLWEAEKLLNQYCIEHLIIVSDNSPVGIITKAQLYMELGKCIDPLTGLNTADFIRYKAFELLQQGNEISIIFCDVDNFGAINKAHGHIIGDKILCEVAQILIGLIDANTDYLCRYAGDEFSIVTTRHLDTVMDLTTRISDVFTKRNWPSDVKVTLSSGIARGQRDTCNGTDLMKTVNNVINQASLASTKAKREKVIS
jgi:IMP dehydrogenase